MKFPSIALATMLSVVLAACEGPVGPQGPEGKQGAQGMAGAEGKVGQAGPKGDKGDRGEKGDKGDRGDKGEKGDKGEQGTAAIRVLELGAGVAASCEAGEVMVSAYCLGPGALSYTVPADAPDTTRAVCAERIRAFCMKR